MTMKRIAIPPPAPAETYGTKSMPVGSAVELDKASVNVELDKASVNVELVASIEAVWVVVVACCVVASR